MSNKAFPNKIYAASETWGQSWYKNQSVAPAGSYLECYYNIPESLIEDWRRVTKVWKEQTDKGGNFPAPLGFTVGTIYEILEIIDGA